MAAAPPERLQRALLAPLSLARVLAAPELQPLRTAAAAAGHVALALSGGRALYVFDGPLPTAPTGSGPAAHAPERGAQAVLLSSHRASPVCALAYVERARAVFLLALQEDAGVAVWVRDANKRTGEWRPLAAATAYASGPPLALPPAAGHRGDVRAACVCAHSPRRLPSACADETAAPAPRSAVDLAWLLHSRDGGRTELLVRVVPLAADTAPGEARGAAQRACPVERLGKYADATRLLCAGGSDLWVWTSRGVAYRWCLHLRRCLARVDVAAACGRALQPASGSLAAPVATLHHPTRELLALCPNGAVLAVSPALRPAAARDDGFADGQLRVDVRRVSTLELTAASGGAHDIAAHGSLMFVLRSKVLAQVVGVARSPFTLSVHHAPTGKLLSLVELPALGAPAAAPPGASAVPPAAGLLNAHGAGGTFVWMGGAAASCFALLVPDACAALAAMADPEEHDASPPRLTAVSPEPNAASRAAVDKLRAVAALLGEASSWGGSLERCEAALAVTFTQAALRAGCVPGTDKHALLLAAAEERIRAGLWRTETDTDKLSGALHPVLRSLVALQPLLYAAASDSPVIAMAAAQAADAIREVYSPAPGSSSTASALEAFRVYTPLAAAVAPLAVAALQSQGSPAAQTDTAAPAWLWATLLDGRRTEHRPRTAGYDGRREWARAGAKLAAIAARDCQQKHDLAAMAAVTLFTFMLGADVSCECASLGCLRHHNPKQINKLDASPAVRASLLANALARAVASDLALPGQANADQMPAFEAACLCLAETSPSALPLFVRATSALAAAAVSSSGHQMPGKTGPEHMHLAQRALHVLQPALGSVKAPLYACRAALRAAVCSHAELLCLAGRPAAGMWLALHPTDSSDGQPDWATAVRLLEKECANGGSCNSREASLLAVPLMFEVLALKVCETLAPDDDSGEAAGLVGVEPEDESEALAACVAHLFIAAKTVGAAVRRNASANPSSAALQPHEPPLTVLDAVHDLLEQSVHGWRCTARLKA